MRLTSGPNVLYLAFAALIVLLTCTIGCSFWLSGAVGMSVALTIATLKMLLVMLVFMNLRQDARSIQLAAVAGFLWLAFANLGVMADYVSRGWNEVPGHDLETTEIPSAYDRVKPELD